MSTPLTDAERTSILDAQIGLMAAQGFRLTARTPTTAQLVKPKEFSAPLAILSFLACGVGVLVYMFIYWADRDQAAYLTIDEYGEIAARFDPPRGKADGWTCQHCGYRNHRLRAICKSCRQRQGDTTRMLS